MFIGPYPAATLLVAAGGAVFIAAQLAGLAPIIPQKASLSRPRRVLLG